MNPTLIEQKKNERTIDENAKPILDLMLREGIETVWDRFEMQQPPCKYCLTGTSCLRQNSAMRSTCRSTNCPLPVQHRSGTPRRQSRSGQLRCFGGLHGTRSDAAHQGRSGNCVAPDRRVKRRGKREFCGRTRPVQSGRDRVSLPGVYAPFCDPPPHTSPAGPCYSPRHPENLTTRGKNSASRITPVSWLSRMERGPLPLLSTRKIWHPDRL